jgi:hypothetical protein
MKLHPASSKKQIVLHNVLKSFEVVTGSYAVQIWHWILKYGTQHVGKLFEDITLPFARSFYV